MRGRYDIRAAELLTNAGVCLVQELLRHIGGADRFLHQPRVSSSMEHVQGTAEFTYIDLLRQVPTKT